MALDFLGNFLERKHHSHSSRCPLLTPTNHLDRDDKDVCTRFCLMHLFLQIVSARFSSKKQI